MAAFVCAHKGCWLKDLKGVSIRELHVQYELIMKKMPLTKE